MDIPSNGHLEDATYRELPGFAGIDARDVQRPGWSVDETGLRLARMATVLLELSRIACARLSSEPVMELKMLYARIAHEDALHYAAIEKRLHELRSQHHRIQCILDYQLGDVLREVMWSSGTIELATAFFSVFKSELLKAIDRYLERANPLADYPSIYLLKHLRLDLNEHMAVGEQVLSALLRMPGSSDRHAAWENHLRQYLAVAGGILGDEPAPKEPALPAPVAEDDFRIPPEFARDNRFRTIIPKTLPPAPTGSNPIQVQLYHLMWRRSQEVTAAELCATVAYEWEDMDALFLCDLTRHGWDEARHSMFGRAALKTLGVEIWELPAWVGYAGHTLAAPPPKRYAHLAIATEAPAMRHPGGKRGEWEFARDQAKHPLVTTFQDFDWADEVVHVQFGRRWITDHYFNGNRQLARALGDETVREREAFYARYAAMESEHTAQHTLDAQGY